MSNLLNSKAIVRLALLVAPVVLGLPVSGCVTTVSQTCGDGLICPANTSCDVENHRCVSATERTACAGLDEGASCTLLGAKGACRSGICQPHFCGDGVVSDLEQCDGAPAPVPGDQTCSSHGGRGFARCTESCQAAFDRCETMGWQPVWQGDGCGGPLTTPIQAIWGSGADDVWAVADGMMLHWDGATWSATGLSRPGTPGPSAPAPVGVARWSGVWGTGPNDVWAASLEGGILHWNGYSWEPSITLDSGSSTPTSLPRLWGTGARDVYVFGESLLKRWDGSQWADVRPSQSSSLVFFSMTGSGPSDVFVLDQATVWHFDGNTWGTVNIGDDQISAIWAPSVEVGYALGAKALYQRDGASWAPIPGVAGGLPVEGGGGQAVWGTGPDDVFVITRKAPQPCNPPAPCPVDPGDLSTVRHWNGVAWTTIYEGHPPSGVWADGRDKVFLVGAGGILSPSVATWLPALSLEAHAMWGVGEDLFALTVGQTGAVTYATDGSTSFTLLPPTPMPTAILGSIWASATNDIWVSGADVNGGYVWHWDGMSWSLGTTLMGNGSTAFIGNIPALGGSGPSDVWAVRDFGTHWDGHTWSEPERTAVRYAAVWAASSKDAYEVGAAGSIRHWDGKAWTEMTSGTTADLYDVWGSGPDDVYAVGAGATLHLDAGRQWSPLSAPTNFKQLKGSSSGNVFASDGFNLYHLRAGAWEPISMPGYNAGQSLWVTPRSVYVSPWGKLTGGMGAKPGTGMNGAANVQRLDLVGVTCQSPETNCTDGWDNDCDGLQDGYDPDCAGKAAMETCGNRADDDYDGLTDCDDPDCAAFPNCAAGGHPARENCANYVDDDYDGLADCGDPDCAAFPNCM